MADLIKKIKIKKQDGTFTDYIPIGAEAQNITTLSGESVENKIHYYDNNKVKNYISIEDMQQDMFLQNEDVCLIDNNIYNIVDLNHMTEVTMTLDNNTNKYYLNGNIEKIGNVDINNPCTFRETYPQGLYYTRINNQIKIFYLDKSLKSIPTFSCYDVLWFDPTTQKFQRQDNVNRVSFIGNETYREWDNSSYSEDILRFHTTTNVSDAYDKNSTSITVISNRFPGQQLGIRTGEAVARQLDSSGINIFINKNRLSSETREGFKEWIVEHPLDIIYQTIASELYNPNLFIDIVSLENGKYGYCVKKEDVAYHSENIISIKDYEKYCTYDYGFQDWTPAFNKALEDKVSNLYLPKDVYRVTDTITIGYPIKIEGDTTEESTIQFESVKEDFDGDSVLKLESASNSVLKNFKIHGVSRETSFEMVAGLYIYHSGSVVMDNVKVSSINGSGIKIQMDGTGTLASYDCKLSKCVVYICAEHGFWLDATDLFLTQCVAHNVWKHGFYLTKSNSLLSDCKAYWTGKEGDETTGDGYYLESVYQLHDHYPSPIAHKTRMLDCEAQECGRYGFTLKNTDCCQLIGCQSETNGMYCTESTAYGFYLYNNRNLILIGSVANQQSLVGWIKCPIYFSGGYDNTINLTTQALEYESTMSKIFEQQYVIHYWNPSNQIIINNNEIFMPDIVHKLYAYDETQDIITGFSDGSTSSQGKSFEIDYTEQSQKLGLSYYTNASAYINTKIQKDFSIPLNRFNKIGIAVEGKCYSSNMHPYLRVRFYDSSDNELNQVSASRFVSSTVYDKQWLTYHVDGEAIPENTTKIRIELFIQHTNASIAAQESGAVWFKNLKIKFYND